MFFDLWNAFYKEKEEVGKYLIAPFNTDIPPSNDRKQVIQPYDDSPLDKMSVGEYVYLDMIERAAKYVYVFTPYLILDDMTRGALCRAAMRGVDVRIVTPAIPDKKAVYRLTRANYGILLRAGVKIYEYTPGFIHAKSMLCDGECAVVGTINLDYRSLYLHFENAVYFANCQAVADLARDCEETFASSKLCTKENTKRGIVGRLIDSILRVFETLL
jgi:cardiolipin synthase